MICDSCGNKSRIIYNTMKYGNMCNICYRACKEVGEDRRVVFETMYIKYGLIKDEKGEWVHE